MKKPAKPKSRKTRTWWFVECGGVPVTPLRNHKSDATKFVGDYHIVEVREVVRKR